MMLLPFNNSATWAIAAWTRSEALPVWLIKSWTNLLKISLAWLKTSLPATNNWRPSWTNWATVLAPKFWISSQTAPKPSWLTMKSAKSLFWFFSN